MNKFIAHGYLAADPDLRYFADQTAVVNFSMGVTKKWKDKESGQTKEKTEWPRFVSTGRQAEVIAEYFKKGSEILITDSELRTRSYNNNDGYKVYVSEFYINHRGFEFCGKNNSFGDNQKIDHGLTHTGKDSDNFDNDVPY